MGTLYIDTGGAATNSGSSDNNSADLSGSAATVSGSVVTLDGSPDLSGVSTSGATQAAIYLNDATNSNQKIFWITAVDNSAKTVTVSVAPTGVVSSSWAIGGRMVLTPANYESAVRAGDEIIFNNSPATRTAAFITTRVAGNSASGHIKWRGKTGTRPVLNVTNTSSVIAGSLGNGLNWIENFELDQDGASGSVINGWGNGGKIVNVKVSDGGGIGYGISDAMTLLLASEITGVGSHGLSLNAITIIKGNYIHDLTGDGINNSGANPNLVVLQNIIDTCAGRGIQDTGAATNLAVAFLIEGNTVYGCGSSGLEVTDADRIVMLFNNIFSENGDAAGEYNIEWLAGAAENVGLHGYNVFYHSGGGGGANLSGLTVNAQVASSEFTTDPAFTNAAGGDFSIGSSSPAKAAGYPGAFLGGSTGYLDIGAVQRQEASGGSGSQRVIGG